MKVKIYNQEGKETGEQELDPEIFAVKIKPEVVYQAVIAQLANIRLPIAHTKTRGEVKGGGKKPWKQKHTGRARAGSIRSPLWRGGGVIFGPRKERVFKQKINKKMKKKALFMCLSDKAANNKLILVDKLELEEIKTKKMIKILENLPVKKEKTLIILGKNDKNIICSSQNIPFAKTVLADSLNVVDLLNYRYLLFLLEGMELLKKSVKR